MNRKQFLLALVFVAVFSFLGGIVGGTISGGGIIVAAKDLMDLMDDSSLVKKIDTIKSEYIEVDSIRAKEITIANESNRVVGRFATDSSGNPTFALFSKENPWIFDIQKAVFAFGINKSGPLMAFFDKDFDERITIGIGKLEPFMAFRYRNKLRLGLGTNILVDKTTGNKIKSKGSVVTYDNKMNMTSMLP